MTIETLRPARFLRLEEVKSATGLSRSTIYASITKGLFPRPIKLGERAVAWLESEIQNWISEKTANRGGK